MAEKNDHHHGNDQGVNLQEHRREQRNADFGELSRWISDSFAPVVDSMCVARWQSQSANPATSQTGSTKYIRISTIGSFSIATLSGTEPLWFSWDSQASCICTQRPAGPNCAPG
ncbi:hypothetical protein [Mesorhizobium sp. B1-1-7]|uniref:hypothetical protein n=1 Tax=unclassified Mesorhizobium TaxID=325217 RepID=UPI0032B1EE76